jgi:hypothetical protein
MQFNNGKCSIEQQVEVSAFYVIFRSMHGLNTLKDFHVQGVATVSRRFFRRQRHGRGEGHGGEGMQDSSIVETSVKLP